MNVGVSRLCKFLIVLLFVFSFILLIFATADISFSDETVESGCVFIVVDEDHDYKAIVTSDTDDYRMVYTLFGGEEGNFVPLTRLDLMPVGCHQIVMFDIQIIVRLSLKLINCVQMWILMMRNSI